MCRLVCTCVVHKPPNTGFLMSRPIYKQVLWQTVKTLNISLISFSIRLRASRCLKSVYRCSYSSTMKESVVLAWTWYSLETLWPTWWRFLVSSEHPVVMLCWSVLVVLGNSHWRSWLPSLPDIRHSRLLSQGTVKSFRVIPEFRILRLTFHRKSASKILY